MPEYMETFGLLVVPPVVILILFALPFFNNTGEKSWRRRPVAMLTVVLTYLVMGILTYLGYTSPWSPQMDAWSGAPIDASFIKGRAPLELQGLVVMQNMQCRTPCGRWGGGHRGPDLPRSARAYQDQLFGKSFKAAATCRRMGGISRPTR
jgi:ubiquinol-cytochrome c reductase cytochrome b subunit